MRNCYLRLKAGPSRRRGHTELSPILPAHPGSGRPDGFTTDSVGMAAFVRLGRWPNSWAKRRFPE